MLPIKGVYIIVFDNGCKIGMSDNCMERLQVYQEPWCRPFKSAFVLKCRYPRIVEAATKRHFKDNILGFSTEFIKHIHYSEIKDYMYKNRTRKPVDTEYDKHWDKETWQEVNMKKKKPREYANYVVNDKDLYFLSKLEINNRIRNTEDLLPDPKWDDC